MRQGWREAKHGHPARLAYKLAPWVILVCAAIFFQIQNQNTSDQAQHAAHEAQEITRQVAANTAVVAELGRANRDLVNNLQRAVVESCQRIGNARAKVAREEIREEIQEAKHPDPELIRALGLPPRALERLVRESVVKLEGRLERVKIVNCAKQYDLTP